MNKELFYSVPEVAAILGLSQSNTYSLVRKNEIPNVKIRGRYLIPKDLFQTFLNRSLRGSDDSETIKL